MNFALITPANESEKSFFVQVFTVLGNEVIGSVPYALANSARKEEDIPSLQIIIRQINEYIRYFQIEIY